MKTRFPPGSGPSPPVGTPPMPGGKFFGEVRMDKATEQYIQEYPRLEYESLADYLGRFWGWLEGDGGWCVCSAKHQGVVKERDKYRTALDEISDIANAVAITLNEEL